jgi:hypothetical protein
VIAAVVLVGTGTWWLLRGGSGAGSVTLAAPSAYHGTAGFPVRFPHTELGAASAAAAALEGAWTLDAEQAMAAAELYAPPAQRELVREGARSVAEGWRKTLGLPVDGELPAGAVMRISTTGVQWRARSGDEVHVSLLVQLSATRGGGVADPTFSSSYAMNLLMAWQPDLRGGDWANIPDPRPVAVPAVAAPGTSAFTAAGWTAIAPTAVTP